MKQIAAVLTQYFHYSHADVIVGKFLKGFPTDEGLLPARVQIASLYLDQVAERDIGRQVAAQFGLPIHYSIRKALMLGGDKLAVDGVLIIGEHGDYPWNERQQQLFPRKYFMEQVCGVFAESGRAVPVFNDKHLSYNWHDAKWMYDRARQLGAPYMAGSSLPVGYRSPWVEHDLDAPLQEAVVISYSGLDVYGFHALETLQCMVERRSGGETGVAAVTCLEGEAVWRAVDERPWIAELAEAACAQIPGRAGMSLEAVIPQPALFLVEYRDGFRGAVLMHTADDGVLETFAYAGRTASGEVAACEIFLPEDPHPHFSYLSLNVEEMFLTGKPTYPIERTLLTTGVLEAALESRARGYQRVETPYLDVTYRSYESLLWRPRGPRPIGAAATPWRQE
jgi:hypothetical protein